MVLGDLDSYMQKNESQLPTDTTHKNKFKVDKDLNISHNTIKVLGENISRKISDIPRSNIFTDISLRTRNIKERINKWYLIKMKSFFMAKENISRMKREPTIWKIYLPMIH